MLVHEPDEGIRAMRRLTLNILFLFVLLYPGAARAQTAFVSRLGRDTVAVESFTRQGDLVRGTSVVRSPRTTVRRYELRLRPDGSPAWLRIRASRPGGTAEETTEYTWRGDSVLGTFRRDTVQRRWAVEVAGRPLPYLDNLYATWDAALRQARAGRPLALVDLRQVLRYNVQAGAGGALVLRLGLADPEHSPVVARIDPARGLTALDMTATTTRYQVARVARLNVEALAAEFARRERAGGGLGALSPRDTLRATVGRAHVLIDYSRPSVRGRTVFGGLLAPFGQVWRTGADAATQLATDREIEIGGTVVPAGTYSLFSLPNPASWVLILNREHGQWGTEYDAGRDLARMPLTLRQTAPVERFTISVAGGMLRLAWADREGSIALRGR